jgi:dihydrofolate reductase
MRHVCLSVAMSLDGYIAGPNGEYDWIPMDPDIDFPALFGRFDTVVLGRKSYEASKRQGHPATGLPTFVFSHTLRQEDCPGVTVSADPAAVIAGLKGTPGRDVWLFGGGSLFRSLLDLGLVDRVQAAIVPVLLGGGVALLPAPAPRARLRLLDHRIYPKTGTILMEYEVIPCASS